MSSPRRSAPDAAGVPADGVPLVWEPGHLILDRYEIKEVFEGGNGRVCRVFDREWGMDLAVKSPLPRVLERSGGAEAFVREAQTWINLEIHPNIVSCHFVSELGGIPRLFAEYVDGGHLHDWIGGGPGERGRLYEGSCEQVLERILDVAIQFAWGLSFAHERGLVHLDVKPGNVMMTSAGVAKVTDFGLSKAGAFAAPPGLPSSTNVDHGTVEVSGRGLTVAYCSPEQAAGALRVTRASDVWSWAVSVLHMFTGQVTWQTGSCADRLLHAGYRAVLGEDVADLPVMPPRVVELLSECLSRGPEERSRMTDVARRLLDLYPVLTGRPHVRSAESTVRSAANILNNKAVGLFELGLRGPARVSLERALQAAPRHFESNFNLGLLRWRSGELTDDALVAELARRRRRPDGSEDERVTGLLRLLHAERGDPLSATRGGGMAGDAGADQVATELQMPVERVKCIALSDDGCTLLLAAGSALQAWDTAAGTCRLSLDGIAESATALLLCPDGKTALVGAHDGITAWSITTGACVGRLAGHGAWITSLCASADGAVVFSGGGDGTARLWDLRTGRCLRVLRPSTRIPVVPTVSLGANGRTGVVAVRDEWEGAIQVWDLAAGTCLSVIEFEGVDPLLDVSHGDLLHVSSSGDTAVALVGGLGFPLQAWDLVAKRRLRSFYHALEDDLRVPETSSLCVSADGESALAGGTDGVRLWEVGSGRCLRTLSPHAADHVAMGRLGTDRRWIAAAGPRMDMLTEAGAWVSSGDALSVWEHRDSTRAAFLLSRPSRSPPRRTSWLRPSSD